MNKGEIWFAATPGGDRPVLVLTRDPVRGPNRVSGRCSFDANNPWARIGTSADRNRGPRAKRLRCQLRQPPHRPAFIISPADCRTVTTEVGGGVSKTQGRHRMLTENCTKDARVSSRATAG